MIASNLVKRIHPIYAQSKPKVPYLSTDVLMEHSIDSPLVMPIGGVPHHYIFLTLFAMPAQQLGWLCTCKQPMHPGIGKYQMTFTGPPLVLVPSFDGPSLYHGASHLGHLSKSLYFSPWYNMQSLKHVWIFLTSRPMGQIICLAKYVFSGNFFF